MNKLFLSFLAICLGALAFVLLHQSANRTHFATALIDQQWLTRTNQLAETQEKVTSLRDEVLEKKRRLRQALRHPNFSPELLLLLEGDTTNGHSAAWAELRMQSGIGWDSSPDQILVSKQTIKQLEYSKVIFGRGGEATEQAIALLGLTSDEQSSIRAAFEQARDGQWLNIQRAQPSGDIVAQYTIPPPDPAFEQGQSNNFAADITTAIGPERASFFLPQAWNQYVSDLAPSQSETMTIRQTVVDGQPDLVCEVKQGANIDTSPVRYARYPGFPVLKLFPLGWQGLAQAEGFDLPPSFNGQNSSPP